MGIETARQTGRRLGFFLGTFAPPQKAVKEGEGSNNATFFCWEGRSKNLVDLACDRVLRGDLYCNQVFVAEEQGMGIVLGRLGQSCLRESLPYMRRH